MRLKIASATVDATGLTAQVVGLDGPYGNLVTNVPEATFARLGYKIGDSVSVTVAEKTLTMPFVKTFSDVPEGQPLLYIDKPRPPVGGDQHGRFREGQRNRSAGEDCDWDQPPPRGREIMPFVQMPV